MSRLSRTSLFAIVATAAIAVSALTPTNASAWGHFGGGLRGGLHGHYGYHFGGSYHHFPYRFGHWGYGRYHWGFGGYRFGYGYRWWYPRFGNCWRFGWCYPHPRPIIGGPGVGAVATTAAAMAAPVQQPVAQQPNCLVKQYLPNGAVAFADVCTQEQAIATPNGAPNMPNALPMHPGQPGPQ
ncbi:MAG TPA: hypothetical protein VKX28_05220 [Xanthobacteraceae bacterium]|nr:hypothetical protein [Xanthobacteraceae bacterium]